MENQRKKALKCQHVRKDGSRCKAIANRKSGLCAVHSGAIPRLGKGRIDITKDLVHVRLFLSKIVMEVKRGRIKPNECNAIVNGCNTIIRVFETEEVQKYLAENQIKSIQNQMRDGIPADYLAIDD